MKSFKHTKRDVLGRVVWREERYTDEIDERHTIDEQEPIKFSSEYINLVLSVLCLVLMATGAAGAAVSFVQHIAAMEQNK